MSAYHRFYDFTFGESNAGYFEIRDDGSEIYMIARFKMGDQILDNPFWIKYEGNKVTAYKQGDGKWVDFGTYGANHYPTSAFPLLLPQVKDQLEYIAVREGDGKILGPTILKLEGDEIREIRDDQVVRSFVMKDGIPVTINWNGPVSHLRSNFKEAIAGSSLADS